MRLSPPIGLGRPVAMVLGSVATESAMEEKTMTIGLIIGVMRDHWDLPADCDDGELFTYAEILLDRIGAGDRSGSALRLARKCAVRETQNAGVGRLSRNRGRLDRGGAKSALTRARAPLGRRHRQPDRGLGWVVAEPYLGFGEAVDAALNAPANIPLNSETDRKPICSADAPSSTDSAARPGACPDSASRIDTPATTRMVQGSKMRTL